MATIDATRPVIASNEPISPPTDHDEARHQLLLSLTEGTNRKIEDLTRRTGYDKGELIDVAMTLMQLSLQAVEEGKLVGVVAPDQDLELEFVGFHKDDPADA